MSEERMNGMTRDEARKAWIDALRSGQYKQGDEYLCRDRKHCCLGVLCRVLKVPARDEGCGLRSFNSEAQLLPAEVAEFIGLHNEEGCFERMKSIDKKFSSLVEMNDTGTDFPKIADFLEQHPELVFVD